MLDLSIKNQIDPILKKLASKKSLDVAEELISVILNLIGIKCEKRELLNIPRIDAELPRFELAPGFARQAAAFKIPIKQNNIFDIHFFCIKKTTKTNLSWLVGITPNFEDSEANKLKNIGIDFVTTDNCDRLIILLSNRYKIRSLELKDKIYPTQNEILSSWIDIGTKNYDKTIESKNFLHKQLWDSFNFEPINDKFYLELVEHFGLLVNHLEKIFGKKPSVMFTTRLIGRVLFIWFLKKKELINKNINYFIVDDPLDQISYYKNKLEILIFDTLNKEISERKNKDNTTPYLNGGLFDISQTDFYDSKELTFPNGFFNQLYETLNKYNFTVDESSPDFQQVAVDPEMLGRIFESLLKEQINENTGKNKKDEAGAVYTPREIVVYMCEQVIIEFLKEKIPFTTDRDRRIEELIRLPESIFRDQDQNKRRDWKPYNKEILKVLLGDNNNPPIRILDPAVGSGAFPMGMLNLLVKIFGRLDSHYEKNISILKRDILSQSLYGVDIEHIAIEICRLRAWLSIIVNVEDNKKVEPLPNLDFKFTCAATLIPLDNDKQSSLFEDLDLKEKLILIRNEYFTTTKKNRKIKLQQEYEKITNSETLFDNQRTKQLKSYRPFDVGSSSSFYDPELHHGVKLFDIIIGNPPYLREKGNALIFKAVNESSFGKKYHQGKMNFLYYFFHFSIDTIKKDGIIAFITSRYWINSLGASKLIKRLEENTSFVDVVDIGKLKVFDNVAGHHMISVFSTKKRDIFKYKIIKEDINEIENNYSNENNVINYLKNSEVFQNNEIVFTKILSKKTEINIDNYYEMSQGVIEAPDKISAKQLEKNKNEEFKIGQGIFVLNDEELKNLKLNEEEKKCVVKYLDTNDVFRWKISPKEPKWLIYSDKIIKKEIENNKKFSNLKKHLNRYINFITSSNKPYGLNRPRDSKYFNQKKIIFKGMFKNPEFTIDTKNYYVGMSFISIIQKKEKKYSLEYLLGILNSKFASDWFNLLGKKRGVNVDIGIYKLKVFQLPTKYSEKIHKLVEKIMISHTNEIENYENNLNNLVYKSYDLTYEEIRKIDPNFKLTISEYKALEI